MIAGENERFTQDFADAFVGRSVPIDINGHRLPGTVVNTVLTRDGGSVEVTVKFANPSK